MSEIVIIHTGIILYIALAVISYYIWRVWPIDIRRDEDALACGVLWSFVWPIGWFIGLIVFLSYEVWGRDDT